MKANTLDEMQLKVEIKLVDGEWQWLGLLTPENLTKLTQYADKLNTKQEISR